MPGRPWTDDELEVLRDRYPSEGGAAVADALGRSRQSVYTKAERLGLHPPFPRRRRWSAAEDAELRRDYPTLGSEELARRLDRTPAAIKIRASIIGVNGPSHRDRALRSRHGMSEEMITAAEAMFARGITYQDIGRVLGVHPNTITMNILPEVREIYQSDFKKAMKRRLQRQKCQAGQNTTSP